MEHSANTARMRLAALTRHMRPALALHCRTSVRPGTSSVVPRSCASFSTSAINPDAWKSRKPLIPPQSGKDIGRLTVVLDMDETLLHSSLVGHPEGAADPRSEDEHRDAEALALQGKKSPEYSFLIGSGRDRERVRSTLRPGLRAFLLALSERFEPILFTSALPIYARPLLDMVEGPKPDAQAQGQEDPAALAAAAAADPSSTVTPAVPADLYPLLRHRLYRPATVPAMELDYDYVKDVRLLGRDMRRVVLIDNAWHACLHAPDNCVVVPDYLGAKEDPLFPALLAILDEARTLDDVRPFLASKFAFRKQLAKHGFKFPGIPPANPEDQVAPVSQGKKE